MQKLNHKLKYINNIRYSQYYIGGNRVKTLKSVRIDGEYYKVIQRRCTSTSVDYCIKTCVFGNYQSEFDLAVLCNKVKVYPIDYTLEKGLTVPSKIAKLEYKNDWYNDTYFINKRRVKELSLVEINDKIYAVTSRYVSVDYPDMGHTYTSTSRHFYIKTNVLGKDRELDLNTIVIDTDVYGVDYKLEPKEKD